MPADSKCDVLVVGAGPAGFMAALTLARYKVDARVIDVRPERIQTGHAGGIQPRTQEVLQTLNLRHQLDTRGNHVSEMAFWAPNNLGQLERTYVGQEIQTTTPYPWILSVPQRETERAFDEELQRHGCQVDRPVELIGFAYVDDDTEYPLHVRVKHRHSNVVSTCRTKYLLGADGAGSKTRQLLGFDWETHGSQDEVWCVADVQLQSDFPDLRRRCAIRAAQGRMMLIPNALDTNRIYTLLNDEDLRQVAEQPSPKANGVNGINGVNGYARYSDTALEALLRQRVRDVAGTYKMEIKQILWISQYRLQQRIVDQFWDQRRVFILGDACHTHSTSAAQGLNTSVADAYNLTWKLALVLQGRAQPSLLSTYALERRQMAQELIDFDVQFSHLFSRKDFREDTQFQDTYKKAQGFTSGVGQQYQPGPLTRPCEEPLVIDHLAVEPLTPGKRLYPIDVYRHLDGTRLNLLNDLPSNGRFHLCAFVGSAIQDSRLAPLTDYLASSASALSRFDAAANPAWGFEDIFYANPQNRGRIVDLFLVHSDSRHEVRLESLPAPLPQWKYRVYEDPQAAGHRLLGVDPRVGALALVRPDGFISLVVGLDEGHKVTELLREYLI
ncbi:uncharacterized protein BO72DRAFT_516636 [Aspergillus fijiensis CBS 313.89]|uniref:FAD binding domain protein n=1 Tax=Aspergillus fijiensis CBS 313.89 TaxID=1448319 RepID=A0A8G1W3C6_9EURO|nr:uncharacterized protein BO72DRAFT_516636 [Aspergillus fijiensis CBS 313.89]RAK81588.1 hypothetical protein BO72DRAFT_516636 [Aspergillus fijiensis CBS 313.89]